MTTRNGEDARTKQSNLAFSVSESGDREVKVKRVFDALPQQVFEAFTDLELLKLCWGGSWEGQIKNAGDEWSFVTAGPGGEVRMRGVVQEIVPPERLVTTESILDAPHSGEVWATGEFTEQDGKTLLVETFRYESRMARDRAMESGNHDAAVYREAFGRLDDLLASLPPDAET